MMNPEPVPWRIGSRSSPSGCSPKGFGKALGFAFLVRLEEVVIRTTAGPTLSATAAIKFGAGPRGGFDGLDGSVLLARVVKGAIPKKVNFLGC